MAEIILNRLFSVDDTSDLRALGSLYSSGGAMGAGNPNSDGLYKLNVVSGTTSAFTGAPFSVAGVFPAGAYVLGCTINILTAVAAGAGVSMLVGISTDDTDRFGAAIAFAAGTTTTGANFTAGPSYIGTTARDLIFTPNAGSFTAGVVRYTAFYVTLSAPPKPAS